MPILLFVFGAAFGSFIGVVADRYRPESFLFSGKNLGGRSRCDACGATLRWFELVPILSFVAQRGRCRSCSAKFSFKYPLVEILSGSIFTLVPLRLAGQFQTLHPTFYALATLWTLAFLVLLVIALIDLRLSIIPDEANILLGIIGIFVMLASLPDFGQISGSFVGPYALLFGLRNSIWTNHLFAAAFGGFFFAFIVFVTHGRGMGMGDLKFAVPLGLLFGWPDIILVVGIGFIIGSVCGVWLLFKKKKKLKSSLPFGPFLVISAAIVFFFGYQIVNSYFALFPL